MTGLVCLQGGREFTADCVEMDRAVLDRPLLDQPESGRSAARVVAVLAGAARVGSDYDGASRRAERHYQQLIDFSVDRFVVIPDPRTDLGGTLTALDSAIDLLVLPGGSPSSLLGVLSGPVRHRVLELHQAGMTISGASAGAMVVCSSMVRPDRDGDVVDGLGLVDGLALPHWSPGSDRWPVPSDLTLWGLPECGGAITAPDGSVTAVGQGTPSVRRSDTGTWTPLPRFPL
jgi:hypothetical protein